MKHNLDTYLGSTYIVSEKAERKGNLTLCLAAFGSVFPIKMQSSAFGCMAPVVDKHSMFKFQVGL